MSKITNDKHSNASISMERRQILCKALNITKFHQAVTVSRWHISKLIIYRVILVDLRWKIQE